MKCRPKSCGCDMCKSVPSAIGKHLRRQATRKVRVSTRAILRDLVRGGDDEGMLLPYSSFRAG